MFCFRLAAAVLVMLVLAPVAARCDSETAHVQQRIFEAQSQFRVGRFIAALAIFEDVAREHPPSARDPRLRWNMARCYEELGRYEEAVAAFELTSRLADDDARRGRADEKVRTLRSRHFGSVRIECPEYGRVRFEGLPGELGCSAVWPLVRVGLQRGTVIDREGRTTAFEVVVAASELSTVQVGMAPPPPPLAQAARSDFGVWPWLVTGVGVAALGGSIGFKLDGDRTIDEAKRTTDAARYATLRDRHQSSGVGHYALLGLGAASLAAGVALFWLDDPSGGTGVAVGPGGIRGVIRW